MDQVESYVSVLSLTLKYQVDTLSHNPSGQILSAHMLGAVCPAFVAVCSPSWCPDVLVVVFICIHSKVCSLWHRSVALVMLAVVFGPPQGHSEQATPCRDLVPHVCGQGPVVLHPDLCWKVTAMESCSVWPFESGFLHLANAPEVPAVVACVPGIPLSLLWPHHSSFSSLLLKSCFRSGQ